MTAEKIKAVAYLHFAQKGYEGASLGDIAKDVGIKKPSIYNHFASKEALFFSCLESSTKICLDLIHDYFRTPDQKPLHQTLLGFLTFYTNAPNDYPSLGFLITNHYFPPALFKDRLVKHSTQHLDHLKVVFTDFFKAHQVSLQEDPQTCALAYLCLLDGLMVERLWGDEPHYQARLQASWPIFYRGIKA